MKRYILVCPQCNSKEIKSDRTSLSNNNGTYTNYKCNDCDKEFTHKQEVLFGDNGCYLVEEYKPIKTHIENNYKEEDKIPDGYYNFNGNSWISIGESLGDLTTTSITEE